MAKTIGLHHPHSHIFTLYFPRKQKPPKDKIHIPFTENLTFNYELTVTINNIISSRAVTDHCKRISDLFFDKLYIITAIFRKIFVFSDSSDIFFQPGSVLRTGFCFFKKMCYRKICRYLSVNFITYTYRNFIQVSKNIQNRKCNICCSLHSASVF